MNRRILLLSICLLSMKAFSQEYYVKQYRVEKGLPSDIVKACIQDSLGYFWIATDEGIVKYDGINFTSYRAVMHSNYAKGFLKTRDGRLLAYGDLDVMEIKNLGDTVLFKKVCSVSRVTSDTVLSYPKVLFEDAQQTLWASESQAVVRIKNNQLKRFAFDFANRSPQFLRSFSFFEDRKQTLFTTSFQGNVFQLNAKTDTFEPVTEKFPAGVELVAVDGNKLIIGAGEGVFEAALKPEGGFETPVLKLKIPFVSYLAKLPDGKYFIATRSRQHFIASLKTFTFQVIPASIHNINHIYVSPENDTWISGNDGLIMMRENLFQSANAAVTDFIESITEDPDTRLIYYATSQTMYSYDRNTQKNKTLLHMPDGYFQSLLFTKEGVWAANAFKVFLLVDGKIKKQFDFTKYARFITALSRDSEGNIWLAMPGSKFAFKIDRAYNLHQYRVDFKGQGVINMIREGKDGMYIASAGKDSYLFFKAPTDTVFQNISLPLNLSIHTEFNATDLVSMDDKIWLATTEGLLKFDRSRVETINLGSHFSGLPVKSVHPHPHNKLLASTPYGMILYDIETGSHDLFNESSGLLSNTITPQGFFVGRYERVWIGTAKGLCYSIRPLTELEDTPKPLFTRFSVNGNHRGLGSGEEIEYGGFVSIQASSITFPENEVSLQYRILPDTSWKITDRPEIQFSALSSGSHTLEVRAKKNGPYSLSVSSFINFTVAKPFWQRAWFYLVLVAAVTFVMAVTYVGVTARSRKRTRELQRLVDSRTHELRLRNEDLVELNEEKNNLIGIVAHDLKSPLRQIMGLLSLIKMTAKPDDETKSYLGMVEESTVRLDGMIMKILDVEAIDSKQLNLNPERLNFSELITRVTNRYQTEAIHKQISIIHALEPEVYVEADKGYLEQVLENLLSNAIKFSPHERKIYVNLSVAGGNVRCEVRDEGPGITESDMKKLFGKYQKLSARPTGTETSTGLGLSIVKKFVLAMNGKIWCESEYGKGSSFFLSFTESKRQ